MPTPGEQKKVGIVPYDVRLTPGPVPTSGIFDEPTRPVCINVQWIAHIDGVLERLVWEDAWKGENTEVEFAIGEIRKLMKALALGNSCMSLNPLQVRQNPEQPCILESSNDLGETWTPFADILACVSQEFLQQSILDAISNNPELRDSISQTLQGFPDVPGDLNKINLPAFTVADCNNDVIYGYCKALWQYIDAKTVDFLQIMAESSNALGPIDQLLQLIPGYELLPFDDVQDWIESFGDYNFEAYQSSKVVDLEQEIICDLFCIASTGGCTINFGDVYNYFIAKLGGINAPTVVATFAEWVLFMATGDYPNDRIVYLWSAFQLALAFVGQEFLGQNGIERYALHAQAGDPDNEWDLLCEDCTQTWESILDFTLSDYGFVFRSYNDNSPIGEWVDGVGLVATCGVFDGETRNNVFGHIAFDDVEVTYLEMLIDFQKGSIPSFATGYTGVFVQGTLAGSQQGAFYNNRTYPNLSTTLTEYTLTATDTQTIDAVNLYARSSIQTCNGQAIIKQLTIQGTGTKPPQLP